MTCDDFYNAMADANASHPAHGDLPALHRWYSQAGTPRVSVATTYDAAARTFTLRTRQSTPGTAGQAAESKVPVLIPIAVGLLGPDGLDLPLTLTPASKGTVSGTTAMLRLTDAEGVFVFTNVAVEPVPSVLRNFSAPVVLTVEGQTLAQLALMSGEEEGEDRACH